jgi:hypothetical protein
MAAEYARCNEPLLTLLLSSNGLQNKHCKLKGRRSVQLV